MEKSSQELKVFDYQNIASLIFPFCQKFAKINPANSQIFDNFAKISPVIHDFSRTTFVKINLADISCSKNSNNRVIINYSRKK